MMALNYIVPSLTAVFQILFYEYQNKKVWNAIFIVSVNLVGLLQIISGLILLHAVYQVRKFLIDQDA